MNNLKKFNNEAEYSAATLSYPNVSWVVSGDTLHYAKEAPAPPPTYDAAIKLSFSTDACGDDKWASINNSMDIYDAISAITVNGVALEPLDSNVGFNTEASTDYLVEYHLNDDATSISYLWASTPWTCASDVIKYDLSFPPQITSIGTVNGEYINNLIILSPTPPTVEWTTSDLTGVTAIYVPDSAVSTYESTGIWNLYTTILPLSQYDGDIPL